MYTQITGYIYSFNMKDFSIESAVIFTVFFLCFYFCSLIIKAVFDLRRQKQIHFMKLQLYKNQYAYIQNKFQAKSYLNQDFQDQNIEFYEKIIDVKSSLYFLKMVLNGKKY